MKKVLISGGVILLIASIWFIFFKNSGVKSGEIARLIESDRVRKEVLKESVEVSGNIKPIQQQNVFFPKDGIIEEISHSIGDSVNKGDIVAKLWSNDIELNIAQKEFDIEQERRSGSKRKLELMHMELEQLKSSLENRYIRAPFTGIITDIHFKKGELYSTDKPCLEIMNRSSLISKVNIDELDIPLVKVGQKVVFTFDALPEKEYTGTVSTLSLIGKLTEKGIAVREAELVIENPDKEIFTPYSFSSQIIIKEQTEALIVSNKSIIRESDKTFVELKNTEIGKREVFIKPYKNGAVIVMSGLNEGDEVLLQKKAAVKSDDMGIF